jgi:hypothetical protein
MGSLFVGWVERSETHRLGKGTEMVGNESSMRDFAIHMMGYGAFRA